MEMKFYEKIGIRQWKKFVLWLMAQIIRNPKERKGFNYYLEAINLEALKKYRAYLLYNGLIHFLCVLQCSMIIIRYILKSNVFSFLMLIPIICFFMNLYCIMLQRYNWLRIKKVLKKVARN